MRFRTEPNLQTIVLPAEGRRGALAGRCARCGRSLRNLPQTNAVNFALVQARHRHRGLEGFQGCTAHRLALCEN